MTHVPSQTLYRSVHCGPATPPCAAHSSAAARLARGRYSPWALLDTIPNSTQDPVAIAPPTLRDSVQRRTVADCSATSDIRYFPGPLMPHLIKPFANERFPDAIARLRSAHEHVVSQARRAIATSEGDATTWGISIKRHRVELDTQHESRLIGKSDEKLAEIMNISATVERLIAVIEWFASRFNDEGARILECHPSTSDEDDGNDLVIVNANGDVAARCEVCDVASSNAGSNGKERKDIRNLGCDQAVPDDDVARYVCTSPEFAQALVSARRKWDKKRYRYEMIQLNDVADSCLLRVLPDTVCDDGE